MDNLLIFNGKINSENPTGLKRSWWLWPERGGSDGRGDPFEAGRVISGLGCCGAGGGALAGLNDRECLGDLLCGD